MPKYIEVRQPRSLLARVAPLLIAALAIYAIIEHPAKAAELARLALDGLKAAGEALIDMAQSL